MEKEQYYPRLTQSIIISIYYFIAVQAACAIGFKCNYDIELSLEIGSVLALFLLILCIRRRYSLNIKQLFTNISAYFKFIIPLFMVAVGIILLDINIITAINIIMPLPEVKLSALWKEILETVLLVPAIEEIICRGIILKGLLEHYSTKKAFIISALLFAIMHGNIFEFVTAFFIGIISAILFAKTRSLFPSYFLHIINNFIAVMTSKSQWVANHCDPTKFTPLLVDLVSIALFIIGIILLHKIFRSDKFYNQNLNIS